MEEALGEHLVMQLVAHELWLAFRPLTRGFSASVGLGAGFTCIAFWESCLLWPSSLEAWVCLFIFLYLVLIAESLI